MITLFLHCQRETAPEEGFEPISYGSLAYLSPPIWICLRIPFGLDQALTLKLQHITARFSSYILDQLDIAHQISGIVFDLPGGRLFVEEACSGVQSVYALIFISLLFLAYHRRSIVLIPAYIAAAIFSAGLFNIVRVSTIAIAQEWYKFDLANGLRHEALGYTCIALAVLLLASFDRLFQVLFFPLSESNNPLATKRVPNPIKLAWNYLLTNKKTKISETPESPPKYRTSFLLLLLTYGSVLVPAQAYFGTEEIMAANAATKRPDLIWQPPKNLFSETQDVAIENYEHISGKYDISEGEYVDVWSLRSKQKQNNFRVALSQPYKVFHDLCVCYSGTGWKLIRQDRLPPPVSLKPTDGEEAWSYIRASFTNAEGQQAYLFFSGFAPDGTPVEAPESNLSGFLKKRWLTGRLNKIKAENVLMFQLWTTSDIALDSQDIGEAERVFLELRKQTLSSFQESTLQ